MAYVGPEVAVEIVTYLKSDWIDEHCQLAGIALVLYDHIITIPGEARFIWGQKLTNAIILFYLNRWFTFLWVVSFTLGFVGFENIPGCMAQNLLSQAMTIVLYLIWAAFSGIRVFGVSGGNRWPSAFVFALSLVPIATNLYGNVAEVTYNFAELPVVGLQCLLGNKLTQGTALKFAIATRVCVIAADVVVLTITWMKTYALKREADRVGIATPLATMMLRDGTIYFLALLALNIIQIVGWTTNSFIYAATAFETPLSSMIVSRFLMDLRRAAYAGTGEPSGETHPSFVRSANAQQDRPHTPVLRFAPVINDMGGNLSFISDDDLVDGDEPSGGCILADEEAQAISDHALVVDTSGAGNTCDEGKPEVSEGNAEIVETPRSQYAACGGSC